MGGHPDLDGLPFLDPFDHTHRVRKGYNKNNIKYCGSCIHFQRSEDLNRYLLRPEHSLRDRDNHGDSSVLDVCDINVGNSR